MPRLEPLSFEAFQTLLADLLNLDIAQITPDAYFVADLGVDSLRIVAALLRLQEMGLELSLDTAWQIQTVSDAYRYFQAQAQRDSGATLTQT